MLFVIEESVQDIFASGAKTQLDIDGLDYLAQGAAEGSHKITGSRRVLLDLANCEELQGRTIEVIKRAASRVAREGNLHHQLDVYGSVIAGGVASPVSTILNGKRRVEFPLRWFNTSAKIQPVVLLGEDISDARVCSLLSSVGTVLGKLPFLQISEVLDHGGGSKTREILAQHAASQRICVCVVDSDRACPLGQLGGTAQKVQNFKNATDYPLIEVIEVNGRDLENILPDIFYTNSYQKNPQQKVVSELLQYFTQSGEIDLRLHFDIEKGVILRAILLYPNDSKESIFWHSKLPIILSCLGKEAGDFPCTAKAICPNSTNAACTCIVVPGIPHDILSDFFTGYRNVDRFQIAGWLDDSVRSEWKRLGVLIAAWCCGDNRLRL